MADDVQKGTEGLTSGRFAQFACSVVATANNWAHGCLALPGAFERQMPPADVERFAAEIRAKLDCMVEIAHGKR